MGCITKVDREVLRVLDQNSQVRTILHTQVSNVVGRNRNAVATDRDGSEIRMDDTVKEHGGEGRQGNVIYIHRGILYVQNRELIENAGLFVVRGNNVITMAAKSGRAQAAGPDLSKLSPASQGQGPSSAPMGPPRTMGRDKLIGKTITIKKGPYKGLLGIVKDTMGDEARIELHTKNKQIQVKKELLNIKDPISGQSVEIGGKFANRPRGGGFTGANSSYGGSHTPAWGSSNRNGGSSWGGAGGGNRTPAWGSGGGGRTPGWGGDGGRTAYGNDGGRTAYGGDGSRTAYGGDGSRTAYGGATSYGGGTAYGGNDGNRTAYGGFNSGGRTPAWGGSASTSTSKSNLSAPTPGAYNAPTPAPYSAPTPGAYGGYSAPTPGGLPMDAPTPGNFTAPTPGDTTGQYNRGYGGYAAPTPAAAPTPGAWAETPGMDDDPRYD